MKKWMRRMTGWVLGTLLVGGAALLGTNAWVVRKGEAWVVEPQAAPAVQCAIVLGAYAEPDGTPSPMLFDRVHTAVDLYRQGKVQRLLMSGDHGQDDYDEVNAMRVAAEGMGVPTEHIFMDHAGFNTYDTMVRAREVFRVTHAIVVTQRFHLARSVYLARRSGIEAWGVVADRRPYLDAASLEVREVMARCKAALFAEVLRPDPRYRGAPIPITGDGRTTHDHS